MPKSYIIQWSKRGFVQVYNIIFAKEAGGVLGKGRLLKLNAVLFLA